LTSSWLDTNDHIRAILEDFKVKADQHLQIEIQQEQRLAPPWQKASCLLQ